MTLEEIKLIDTLLANITVKGDMVFALAESRNILGREAQKFNKVEDEKNRDQEVGSDVVGKDKKQG